MKKHIIKVHLSKQFLKKEDQLSWKLAECALDPAPISKEVCDMVINRIIDNAAVASASLLRTAVCRARDQAMAFPFSHGGTPGSGTSICESSRNEISRNGTSAGKTSSGGIYGASIFGCTNEQRFFPNWCAWANGVAVRELDFHDTFLAADYSHPADNIPPILAVAQHKGCDGKQLLRGIVAAYEVHIALVKAICLHRHKKDHIAHLCPAQVAGIGTLLSMNIESLYQSINQSVHVSFTTRQSRKGAISSWKAYAPAHAGKLAIEAVDRALRGEKAPAPIYEGEDSVIAYMLDGHSAEYTLFLPDKDQEKRAILESYTKEHSAEYQSQALIDLAFDLRPEVEDIDLIKEIIIHTSHHTHYVIGTGSGDPQKQDPKASRETLDHSITYIFAVALEDGKWHHINSYTSERSSRPKTVRLWHKIKTVEDKKWTELYHHPHPQKKSFGAKVEIIFKDGRKLEKEKKLANAHPSGDKPFKRDDYIQKFMELTALSPIAEKEKSRFISLVQRLPELSAKEVAEINIQSNVSFKMGSQGLFN